MNYYVCVDLQGGCCDRICKGTKGLINNAKASIEAWKFNGIDNEMLEIVKETKLNTLENAIFILNIDNFKVIKLNKKDIVVIENVIITNNKIHKYSSNIECINIEELEIYNKFNKENIYNIF